MKKTILYIAPRLPEFDRASGDLRFYRILGILSQHYTIIVYNDGTWEWFYNRGTTQYNDALEALGIRVIHSRDELRKELRSNQLRCIVCQFYHMANAYKELITTYAPTTPVVLDTVDISFFREQMVAEVEGNSTLALKAEKTKADELAACEYADVVWVVGSHDYHVLREYLPEQKLFTVPNIHTISGSTPPREVRKQHQLLFVGGFLHRPNVDAMNYFCKEIFPLVKKHLPDVKLWIVGDSPPDFITALANDSIDVLGFVPSTKPYIDSAMVSIAPLRAGAGLKGKVGEALAEGLPVVTTSIGAQGMNLVSGEDCFIADSPQEFAESICTLLLEPELWNTCSRNGKRFMEGAFSYRTIEKSLLKFFETIEETNKIATTRDNSGGIRASVVYLTKNGGAEFRESLNSVLNQQAPFPFEVIAVDSGSTDGTLEFLQQSPVRLFTIPPHEFNFGRTRDYGFSLAVGEIVIALSQDAIPVDPDWLINLVTPFEDKSLAVVQGNALHPPGNKNFYWDYIRKFYYTREAERWSSSYGIGLSFVCCAIRRSVWEENKLGNVEMSEDKVFQAKLRKHSLRIIKNNSAQCYHGHDYNLVSLYKRIENEGLGWRIAGVDYSFTDMIKDYFTMDIWRMFIHGLITGQITKPSEFFFPFIRPVCVYIGNHLTVTYVR